MLSEIFAVLGQTLSIYSFILIIRILLTWFPGIDWSNGILSALTSITDPYLNIFRGIIPPIGGFDITWQRSSSKSSWEAYPTAQNEVLRLTQSQVGYSYRAVVSYIDSHGTREVLYTSPSETIDNLDDPVQGEVTITGEPKEGVTLRAISDSLSDEDGIASISISWETSKDGRNWVGLNSLSGPVLQLNQSLVGSQVRARVAVVDNFGIETNLYSQATRTVENVNNKPSGRIVIRRVGQ